MERRRRVLSLKKPQVLKQSTLTGFAKPTVRDDKGMPNFQRDTSCGAQKPLGVVSPMTSNNMVTITSIPNNELQKERTNNADIGFPDSMFLGDFFNEDDFDNFDFSFQETTLPKVSPKKAIISNKVECDSVDLTINEDSNEMIPPTYIPSTKKTNKRSIRRPKGLDSDSESENEQQEKADNQTETNNPNDDELNEEDFYQDYEFIDPPPPSPSPDDVDEYMTILPPSSPPIISHDICKIGSKPTIHQDVKNHQNVNSCINENVSATSKEDDIDLQSISAHPFLSPLPLSITSDLLSLRIDGLKGLLIDVMDRVCSIIEKSNTVSDSVRKAVIFRKRIKAAIKRAENQLEFLPRTKVEQQGITSIPENEEFNSVPNEDISDFKTDCQTKTSTENVGGNRRENLSCNQPTRCTSTPRTNHSRTAVATPSIPPIGMHLNSPNCQFDAKVDEPTPSSRTNTDKVVVSSGFKFKKSMAKGSNVVPSGFSSDPSSSRCYDFSNSANTYSKSFGETVSNNDRCNFTAGDVSTPIGINKVSMATTSGLAQNLNSFVQRKSSGFKFENSFETDRSPAPQSVGQNNWNSGFSLSANKLSEKSLPNKLTSNNTKPKTAVSSHINKPANPTSNSNSAKKVGKYSGFNFPHSNEMMKVFHKVFGLHEFRCNQLEAVNAALMGEDCFVLMPTGGGKSLTYQLPGVISAGVTIVVSPLKSLIQDQVQRLVSLGIPATHLSGELSLSAMDNVYRELSLREPILKLLYVTPEKISNSNKLLSTFDNLYQRGMLARFVIDEVHCVSQWGHDFRPDYKRLCNLRSKYPGVPMMGLTATATPRVRADILRQLQMKNPQWFTQSFDRSNLRYTLVKKKPSTATQEVLQIIKKQFSRMSGIVYCLSRNECEKVARDLTDGGVGSRPYHAGQSDTVRTKVHEDWLNDKVKVVCATIAFGMGIDKPDVRFVIHYSLPKSVEGYYQESGRAGRDGKTAHCVLFYMYKDVVRMRKLIEGQCANPEAQKTHLDNLYRMVQYCENETDCRRMQLLQYFGENDYKRDMCRSKPETICGNCESQIQYQVKDMTQHAKGIVEFAQQLEQSGGRRGRWASNQYTLIHFIEVYKGSVSAKVVNVGHEKSCIHGLGKNLSKSDCERFLRKLVIEGYLREDMQFTALDHAVCYIKVGPKAASLLSGKIRVEMNIQSGSKPTKITVVSPVISETQKLKQSLYDELRSTCRQLGRQTGMNPDNIFNAQTIQELSQKLPLTNEEMLGCTGVTEAKLARFGQHFLNVIYKFVPQITQLEDGDFDDNTSVQENESHYFNSGATSSIKGRQTKRKRAPRTFSNKKMKASDNSYRPTGNAASNHRNTSGGWVSKASYNPSNKGALSKKFTFKGKSSNTTPKLSLMPNPQPRPFLSKVNRL
ncbi:Bloom syndrome protein homolog [Anneissia japonica]|uniref:Bloom syndrome protein homolog n=1 Tax=Anneissia japonica TaxID=1529436 RepID=UPI001425944B|nr:Bloom syndrome protein homolog [Anneissia japonica]